MAASSRSFSKPSFFRRKQHQTESKETKTAYKKQKLSYEDLNNFFLELRDKSAQAKDIAYKKSHEIGKASEDICKELMNFLNHFASFGDLYMHKPGSVTLPIEWKVTYQFAQEANFISMHFCFIDDFDKSSIQYGLKNTLFSALESESAFFYIIHILFELKRTYGAEFFETIQSGVSEIRISNPVRLLAIFKQKEAMIFPAQVSRVYTIPDVLPIELPPIVPVHCKRGR